MRLRKNIIDFTIGSDMELIVASESGKVIGAKTKEGDFSADGINNKIQEVRPRESLNPLDLTKNIKKIFLNKIKREPQFSKYGFFAGSYIKNKPLGGHIHFGVKSKIIKPELAVLYLDNYLSSLLMLSEEPKQGILRRNCDADTENRFGEYRYGAFLDFREKDYGGFEMRCPASFLHSPKITNAAYCLAKATLFEVLNNPAFEGNNFVNADDFTKMQQEKILGKFPAIKKDIKKFYLYKTYKSHIDFLFKLIQENKNWFVGGTMKQNWSIEK